MKTPSEWYDFLQGQTTACDQPGHTRKRIECDECVEDAFAEAIKYAKRLAFAQAVNVIRQGCAWAPEHGKCDHEHIARAIEGYAEDGIDGMIAALDSMREAKP